MQALEVQVAPLETHRAIPTLGLPRRSGPLPKTTVHNPQQQLEQIPDAANYAAMRAIVSAWTGVTIGPSLRAPHGTIGLHLSQREALGPRAAFLLETEFAHLHPLPDGSLHMVLPPQVHRESIEGGWGLPHPMAGMPTVSPQTILIFAPRDADERAVVVQLIGAAEAYARGQ
jgi:Family of unknown function (DUF5519)